MVCGAQVCSAASKLDNGSRALKTAVIAALPRELAGLTRGWRRVETGVRGVTVFENGSTLAACGGMGCDRVSKAVAAALACGGVGRLISIGLGGACDPALAAGEVLRFGTVVDVRSGERLDAEGGTAVLATSNNIAGVEEKSRLFASYGAAVVDMEAACVARLAQAHEISFSAIKAISDDARFSLDGLDQFVTAEGQLRELAFAWYTALRPARWRSTMELGRNSAAALAALTAVIKSELA